MEGTLPFLSIRVLRGRRRQENPVHTAIDDLESFIWVLLWTLLHTIQRHDELSSDEADWLDGLLSDDYGRLAAEKAGIRTQIDDLITMAVTSKGLSALAPLLRTWLDLAHESFLLLEMKLKSRPVNDDFHAFCKGWYQKYIDTGLSHLQNLPMTWDDVFA
jgi:hypothetical protein